MTQEALKLAIQLRDTASGYWTANEIPIIEKLIELLAQPAQEPVAVVVADYALHWVGSGPIAPLIEKHKIKVGDNLYTTTPHRKPLTEEQVDRCIEAADTRWADAFIPIQWARHFKNAIEAAHGIK
jgi:hypothetical protein